MVESAVSAILLVALDPGAADGFSPTRIAEGAIGGAVALVVSSFLFPPDPALAPGRAAQAMFVELGRALERIATALESRDAGAAERALVDARGIDDLIRSVEEEVSTGRETAKYTPPRRSSRAQLDRYARSMPQVDYAVRNTRVLARHARQPRARPRRTCPRACPPPCATSRTPSGSWPPRTTPRRTPSPPAASPSRPPPAPPRSPRRAPTSCSSAARCARPPPTSSAPPSSSRATPEALDDRPTEELLIQPAVA